MKPWSINEERSAKRICLWKTEIIDRTLLMYFARLFGESLLFCSQPNQSVQGNKKENAPVVDHRSVDDLLTFINGQGMEEERLRTNSKAQKRARQKQKKVSEFFEWLVGLLAN